MRRLAIGLLLCIISVSLIAQEKHARTDQDFDLSLLKRTAADMRTIGTAVEAHASDFGRYPEAENIGDLFRFITVYIRNVPETDGWGMPLLYVVSHDANQFRIVSGGADQRIDPANQGQQLFERAPWSQQIVDDRGADLVYQNGGFVQLPRLLAAVSPLRGPLPAGVVRPGGGVKVPGVIHRVDPSYSPDAREARIQGLVILEVIIDQSGVVRDAYVIKGLPYGLDQAALEAVRQWRFEPTLKDNQPVPVAMNLTVNFKLDQPNP